MTTGIITYNNDPSEKFTAAHARLLRTECDDVKTYMECGWFCVLGYKGSKRLVHAHCNSQQDYEVAVGLLRRASKWDSYGESGSGGYLIEARAKYSVDGEKTDEKSIFLSSEQPYQVMEEIAELAQESLRAAEGDETRSISYHRRYWDELPRSAKVTPVVSHDAAAPHFR